MYEWTRLILNTIHITLHEALSGFMRLLEHPDGHVIRIRCVSVTQPGTYTVPGHGIHLVSHGQCGNMYVNVEVMYPASINVRECTLSSILGQHNEQHSPMPGDITLDEFPPNIA
jgi:DnaJ-class molecular chaperone